jgi:hypothetical protein
LIAPFHATFIANPHFFPNVAGPTQAAVRGRFGNSASPHSLKGKRHRGCRFAATAGNPAGSIQTSSSGGSYASTQIIVEKPTDVARNGINTLLDAAFDSAGNLRIVGNTTSDDFTLVNPIVATKAPYRQSGFVVGRPNRNGKVRRLSGRTSCM